MPNLPSALQDFYLNEVMREDVKTYLIQFLTDKAVTKVFAQEDTKAIAEAKDVIDEAFNHLELLFPTKSAVKDIVNESR